jgi:hypothetical protein
MSIQMIRTRVIALCCAAIIAALYVVGLVSGTELRHVVQTAPVWAAVILGWQRKKWVGWLALPMFVFWLAIMVMIWLFLLGWARLLSGHFSPPEVAMTIVVGAASAAGIAVAARTPENLSKLGAAGLFILGATLQFAAFRASLLPGISTR